jgi:hypothetical protein
VHGDVNTAYRIREHEWVKLAKGDPQWPQAFYPTESQYDLKDGDALIGTCTYHNEENRYVYAGSTHTDEMCNIYLMYYADRIDDVENTCSGSSYPQLEAIVPDEAGIKPPVPPSFNGINDNLDTKNANSHHDMEGSKLHHDVGTNGKNKQQQAASYKGLSDFLAQAGLGGSALNSADDYYDDIEQQRSKNRNNLNALNELGKEDNTGGDDQQQSGGGGAGGSFDPSSLLDAAFNNAESSSSSSDDYSDASSLLLAAELAKLNKKVNSNNGNGNDNPLLNRVKTKLNNLIPPMVTSK